MNWLSAIYTIAILTQFWCLYTQVKIYKTTKIEQTKNLSLNSSIEVFVMLMFFVQKFLTTYTPSLIRKSNIIITERVATLFLIFAFLICLHSIRTFREYKVITPLKFQLVTYFLLIISQILLVVNQK